MTDRVIGICGVGQMGAAAAACYRRAGYRVLVWDHNPEKLAQSRPSIDALEAWLDRHSLAPKAGGTIEAVDLRVIDQESDFIMECVVEDMAQKVGLLRQFVHAIQRGAIFITTTSGLSITEMGRSSGTERLL